MDGLFATADPLDLHPRCPWRPLDWRWCLARLLTGPTVGFGRRWTDAWVRRAEQFVRVSARRAAPPRRRAREPDPVVAAALDLRAAGGPNRRLEVEARLLAGQGYDEVASRCGLDPEAVEAYERLFFAVLDRLGAEDFIVFSAMPGLSIGTGPPSVATLIRSFGYFGGPCVLDIILHVVGIRTAPPGSEPDAELVRLTETALAAKRLPVDEANALAVLRLGVLQAEIEAEAAASDHAVLCRPVAVPPGWYDRGAAVAGAEPVNDEVGGEPAPVAPVDRARSA